MRVLGIDPGSLRTGFGVVDAKPGQLEARDYGVIAPAGGLQLYQRLTFIAAQISELASKHQPDLVAIENIFTAKSPRSALTLGQARGAALVGVGGTAGPVIEVAPSKVKSLVAGNGRASKAQVARAVKDQLGLSGRIAADASDALAIALSAVFHKPAPGTSSPRLRVRRISARDAWTEELRHLARARRRRG